MIAFLMLHEELSLLSIFFLDSHPIFFNDVHSDFVVLGRPKHHSAVPMKLGCINKGPMLLSNPSGLYENMHYARHLAVQQLQTVIEHQNANSNPNPQQNGAVNAAAVASWDEID